ncbi:MAG: protease modulator HflC, partial [bacterium]
RADAEATRIYAQSYEQDPDFYNFLKTLETYRETLPKKTLIVVPLGSKFFKYLTPEEVSKKPLASHLDK